MESTIESDLCASTVALYYITTKFIFHFFAEFTKLDLVID